MKTIFCPLYAECDCRFAELSLRYFGGLFYKENIKHYKATKKLDKFMKRQHLQCPPDVGKGEDKGRGWGQSANQSCLDKQFDRGKTSANNS